MFWPASSTIPVIPAADQMDRACPAATAADAATMTAEMNDVLLLGIVFYLSCRAVPTRNTKKVGITSGARECNRIAIAARVQLEWHLSPAVTGTVDGSAELLLLRFEYPHFCGLPAASRHRDIEAALGLDPESRARPVSRRHSGHRAQRVGLTLHDVDETLAADHVEPLPRRIVEQVIGVSDGRHVGDHRAVRRVQLAQ